MSQDWGKKPGRSSTRLMRKDVNADPWRFSPGTLSDISISEMKCSTKLRSAAFEDEYRPLPSSARFFLRAERSPSRSKEGPRVTFAQDRPEEDHLPKKGSSPQIETPPSSAAERPEACRLSPHPRRGHPRWARPEAFTESPGRRRDVGTFQPCSDLCPCSTPSQPPLKQSKTATPGSGMEREPNSSCLYKHMSDLYIAARMPEEASRSPSILEVTPSWGTSLYSPPLDRLQGSQLPWTQGASQSHVSQCPSPPVSPFGLESADLRSLSPPLCATVSTHPLLTAVKNHPARGHKDLGLSEGESLGRTSPPPISELSSVLCRLLDLVDRHWSGPRSLQLNPRFLTPAYDLLGSLTSPTPPRAERAGSLWWMNDGDKIGEESPREKDNRTLGLDSPHLKHQDSQSTQTHQQTESLKNRVATASLHRETVNPKPESALNIFETSKEWDKCLQRQVEALREQEKHFKRLEDTLGLLQDSHRSLFSSNNSLMAQLNNPTTHQNTEKYVTPRI